MKTLNLLRIALLALALPGIMAASILTTSPNPSDLGDLNHDTVWSWRIDNVDLGGHEITSASLTLAGIYNNDNSSNRLFIHLLDSVPNAGTAHRSDPYSTIRDYFLTPSSSFAPQPGPSNVLLDAPSFAGGQANKVDYNYTFTAEQLTILQSFIANNGNLAFGFDPDCHFYNSGISFQMTTAQAPEPGTSLLVGVCLLFGVPVLRRFAPLKSKTRADQASIEPRS